MQDSATRVVADIRQFIPASILEGVPLAMALVSDTGEIQQLNRRLLDLLSLISLDALEQHLTRKDLVLLGVRHDPIPENERLTRLFPRHPLVEPDELLICNGLTERLVRLSTTAHDAHHTLIIYEELTERRRHDAYARCRERLLSAADEHSLYDLLATALDEATQMTESQAAFFHFLEQDQETLGPLASHPASAAPSGEVVGKERLHDIDGTGDCGATLRHGEPLVHNDSAKLVNELGLQAETGRFHRELVVPVVHGGRLLAVMGVGDKPRPYTNDDAQTLRQVADLTWNVAERKRTETDLYQVNTGLRDAQEKFAGAFHVISDGVHITEQSTGRFIEANDGFAKMSGYGRDEILGHTELELELWSDASDRVRYQEQLALRGHVRGFQTRYRTKDARLLWVEHSAECLKLAGLPCVVTTIRDVTAQRAAADALEESEQRFRSMFDLHDAPMLLIEPGSASIHCANAAAERYFDLGSGALIERKLYDLCTISRADTTRLLDASTQGSAKSFLLHHRTSSGELREAEVYSSPIHHLGHTLLFAILHDTTERRRLEEQFRRVQRMDCLGNLASGVAHDMNNVLSAIMAHATVQRDTLPGDSQLAADLDTITQACIRGRTLVRTLLDFARPTLAEQKVLSLNALVEEAVRLLSRTTLNRTQLQLELEPNLGTIRGDPSALGHALMNLCINAMDAMPEGGTLTITTRNVTDTKVELEVKDTGQGMPPEILEKATDPFFSTKPQGKGTGLGLPMVYSAAEAHAAQFEIASQPGRGTRVRLTFPTVDAPIEAAPESDTLPWTPAALSILVVDDDWIVLRGLSRQLSRLGHRVTPCTKGEEALIHLSRPGEFDLAILDVNMPNLGGFDVFSSGRKAGHVYPVLFVTGRPDEAIRQFISTHPGASMLAKPFTQGELQTAIVQLCGADRGWRLTPSPPPAARLRTTSSFETGD